MLVVAVTYNSRDLVDGFVGALADALDGVESARVVVVDNDSDDGTADLLREVAPWVTVLASDVNGGYAAGINAALRQFTAAHGVLVLNPDSTPLPGCAAALSSACTRPVGITVPRILDREGRLKFSLRREPTLRRAVGEALLGGHRAARVPSLGDMIRDPAHYVDGAQADWATGAAMFLSRGVVDAVGLWDETFFLYSEETDYALRARDAGYELRLCTDAVVIHPGGEMSRSPFLWSLVARNRVRLYRKRHGRVPGAAYWVVVFVNELLRAAAGRPTHRAAVRALLAGEGGNRGGQSRR